MQCALGGPVAIYCLPASNSGVAGREGAAIAGPLLVVVAGSLVAGLAAYFLATVASSTSTYVFRLFLI